MLCFFVFGAFRLDLNKDMHFPEEYLVLFGLGTLGSEIVCFWVFWCFFGFGAQDPIGSLRSRSRRPGIGGPELPGLVKQANRLI